MVFRKIRIACIGLLVCSYYTFSFAQQPDPLYIFTKADSVGLNDKINDPSARFNELNSEMGMYEPKTPIQSYLGVQLEKSHVVILNGIIINLVFQPQKEIPITEVKTLLKKKLNVNGVHLEDNKKRIKWTSEKYIIEYNYTETAKRIYVYENPKGK